MFALDSGSNALKSVTSRSFGYGFMYSPTSSFNIKADYQHIAIDNEIQLLDTDALLQTEADCRLGVTPGGQVIDINSPTCVDALSRVVRFPANDPLALEAGQINFVRIGPVNIASESLDGIQTSTDYSVDVGRFGNLDLGASYYIELHHRMQNKQGDPEMDLLHDYNSTEFKSRAAATATWTRACWATSLHAQFSGTSVNSDGSGTIAPYVTWNASERYAFGGKGTYVQLAINNLLDRHPPADGGVGWPYYNVLNFNGFGRSVFLEFGMHFGGDEPKT